MLGNRNQISCLRAPCDGLSCIGHLHHESSESAGPVVTPDSPHRSGAGCREWGQDQKAILGCEYDTAAEGNDVNETLGQKQRRFTRMIAQLIEYACQNGYELTFGDAYRDPRVQAPPESGG